MLPLVALVEETIRQEDLVGAGQDILIALSGGADSVALLRAFLLLGYEVSALHCNFHLRGQESDGDENFVRELCREHNVAISVKHFDTIAYAEEHKVSIEMAARELRYDWFREEQKARGIELIAVAHNADDMVETFLLNLSMGTGIRGLSGMPYKRDDGIIRPLMNVSRKEILDFLTELKQDYREDSSNASLEYKRNFIRHKLIDCFEELNPNFRQNTLETIRHLRGTEMLYLESVEGYRQKLIDEKGIKLKDLRLCSEPKTILYELLRPYGFAKEQILDIATNLSNLRLGAKYVAQTCTLIVSRDYLELLSNSRLQAKAICINVKEQGQVVLPNGLLTWDYLDRSELKSLRCPKTMALFDAEKVWQAVGGAFELKLRPREEGDKIKPFGMQGKKKIRRIFIDGGFTHREREEARLLTTPSNEILWLVGELADATYSVEEHTTKVLRFSFEAKKI